MQRKKLHVIKIGIYYFIVAAAAFSANTTVTSNFCSS